MKLHSSLFLLTLILSTSMALAMERDNTLIPSIPVLTPDEFVITRDVFDENGKQYMEYSIKLWAQAAEESEHGATGLGAIFMNMNAMGIDTLISDPVALEKANLGLKAIKESRLYATLDALREINMYVYPGAPQLRADLARVIMQSIATHVIKTACPDYNTPPTNLIEYFSSIGQAAKPGYIEFLKINKDLDFARNAPYFEALVLVMGYLAQKAAGF